jgi:hypothetical protein
MMALGTVHEFIPDSAFSSMSKERSMRDIVAKAFTHEQWTRLCNNPEFAGAVDRAETSSEVQGLNRLGGQILQHQTQKTKIHVERLKLSHQAVRQSPMS